MKGLKLTLAVGVVVAVFMAGEGRVYSSSFNSVWGRGVSDFIRPISRSGYTGNLSGEGRYEFYCGPNGVEVRRIPPGGLEETMETTIGPVTIDGRKYLAIQFNNTLIEHTTTEGDKTSTRTLPPGTLLIDETGTFRYEQKFLLSELRAQTSTPEEVIRDRNKLLTAAATGVLTEEKPNRFSDMSDEEFFKEFLSFILKIFSGVEIDIDEFRDYYFEYIRRGGPIFFSRQAE